MKLIKRAAAILVLLMGQGCTFLPTGISLYDHGCNRPASSFQAVTVKVQLDQSLMSFNGLDAGARALASMPDGSLAIGGNLVLPAISRPVMWLAGKRIHVNLGCAWGRFARPGARAGGNRLRQSVCPETFNPDNSKTAGSKNIPVEGAQLAAPAGLFCGRNH